MVETASFAAKLSKLYTILISEFSLSELSELSLLVSSALLTVGAVTVTDTVVLLPGSKPDPPPEPQLAQLT